jgi:hypothetical protein
MHGAVAGVLCEMVRSENARRVACNRGGMLDQQLLRCCDATAVANWCWAVSCRARATEILGAKLR